MPEIAALSYPQAEALKDALMTLMLASGGFTHGHGMQGARRNLSAAIVQAGRALRASDYVTGHFDRGRSPRPASAATDIAGADFDIADPVQLVAAYRAAGGEWRALVAAVNRAAFDRLSEVPKPAQGPEQRKAS